MAGLSGNPSRVRIKGHQHSVVRFFLMGVGYTMVWITLSSELGYYSKLYQPQVLLQLNIAYYLPTIPVLIIFSHFEKTLNNKLGECMSMFSRLIFGLVGCAVISAYFPFQPQKLGVLLGLVSGLGALSAIAFSTSYQLVAWFRAADTIALGIGCVGSGPLALLLQLGLNMGGSPTRWQWIAMFEIAAAIVLVGLGATLSLLWQYGNIISGKEQYLDTTPLLHHMEEQAPLSPEQQLEESTMSMMLHTRMYSLADPFQGMPLPSAAGLQEAMVEQPWRRLRLLRRTQSAAYSEDLTPFHRATDGPLSADSVRQQRKTTDGDLRMHADASRMAMLNVSPVRLPGGAAPISQPDRFPTSPHRYYGSMGDIEGLTSHQHHVSPPPQLSLPPAHASSKGDSSGRERHASPPPQQQPARSRSSLDVDGSAQHAGAAARPASPKGRSQLGDGGASDARRVSADDVIVGHERPQSGYITPVNTLSPRPSCEVASSMPMAIPLEPTPAQPSLAVSPFGFALVQMQSPDPLVVHQQQVSPLPSKSQDREGSGSAMKRSQLRDIEEAAPLLEPKDGTKGDQPSPSLWHIFRAAWMLIVGSLVSNIIFTVAFPFFTFAKSDGMLGDRLPQALFYTRIFADILGRLLPRRKSLSLRSPLAVLVLAGLEAAVAVLFFLYLKAPTHLLHDFVPLGIVGALWTVGGYINTNGYIMAPNMVAPREVSIVSALMVLTYKSAHFIGLLLAVAIAETLFGGVTGDL